ncbi:MAG TPA: hypothetical protein VIG32_09185 [Candidatus Baltobacteraceae bacterium]|jgi:hypothetical protein
MKLQLLLGIAAIVAQSMFGGAPVDGIRCDASEGAAQHVHADLQIFNHGRPLEIPAAIGIPVDAGCLYWVHTHSANGIIHIESPVKRAFTLGEFFDIWGPQLSWTRAGAVRAARGARLSIVVNGRPWHGADPRAIVLRDREQIVIQAAPPLAKPVRPNWP